MYFGSSTASATCAEPTGLGTGMDNRPAKGGGE
jgi:hypothetical protein